MIYSKIHKSLSHLCSILSNKWKFHTTGFMGINGFFILLSAIEKIELNLLKTPDFFVLLTFYFIARQFSPSILGIITLANS